MTKTCNTCIHKGQYLWCSACPLDLPNYKSNIMTRLEMYDESSRFTKEDFDRLVKMYEKRDRMTRLETLKKEIAFIKSLKCVSLSIKESAIKYYEKEIEAIEKYGAENPEYEVK